MCQALFQEDTLTNFDTKSNKWKHKKTDFGLANIVQRWKGLPQSVVSSLSLEECKQILETTEVHRKGGCIK